MKKKFAVLFINLIMAGIGITGCSEVPSGSATVTEVNTVSDLLNQEVLVAEGSEHVPYLVLSNDYNGNTLLLRKNLIDEDLRMNEYDAIYENCEVDDYLNTVFYESLDDGIQNILCNSDVEVVAEGYFGNKMSIKTIQRKVFLLSYKEIGQSDSYHSGKEGKALKALSSSDGRIASRADAAPSPWWTRSVDTAYSFCFYAVGAKGEVGSTDASRPNGIRPAFCIPNDTPVTADSENESGTTVYVIGE